MSAPGFHLGLHEPEIAGNAGAIARLCAATGTHLHLIGRLGFHLKGPAARRAGMDYWDRVSYTRQTNLDDFFAAVPGPVWCFSTRGTRPLWDAELRPGDALLFGAESRGLPDALLERDPERVLRIPMLPGTRSLNLATAAAVALYEGLRQVGGP